MSRSYLNIFVITGIVFPILLTAQNPVPVIDQLMPSEPGSDDAFIVMFEEQAVRQWETTAPDHIDTYASSLELTLNDHDLNGAAVSELYVPEAESWQLLLDRTLLPDGFRMICLDKRTFKVMWSVEMDDKGDYRIMTPPATASQCILSATWEDMYASPEILLPLTIYVKPKRSGRSTVALPGFGTSLPCEINAACSQAGAFQDQARSVVRMRVVFEEGAGWCTGTLVNNTAEDATPYILGAEHCQGNFTPMYNFWRFDFLYQSDSCENPQTEPAYLSMTGCNFRAKNRDSDMLLLELKETIPAHYQAFFSGWNRAPDYTPNASVLIHHPLADIKKVSFEKNHASLFPFELEWVEGYSTPPGSHYKMKFDEGGFEPGSSGAGVYDDNQRIIGQLHGGIPGCEEDNTAYIGALSFSWDQESATNARLDAWLDPAGTGQITLDGMENPAAAATFILRGSVTDMKDRPLPDVKMEASGDYEGELLTDENGFFEIPLLALSGSYDIKAVKDSSPGNGVSAADLLLIQKHILNLKPFEDQYQILAADANKSSSISAADLLLLQKLILGLIPELPAQSSWIFDPPMHQVSQVTGDTIHVEFTGIKIGDVNGTADPGQ